jgi:uncharacterized protein YggE
MSAGYDAAFLSSSQFLSRPLRKLVRIAAWVGALGVTLFGSWHAASGQAKTVTTTTLVVTSASGAVTTAPSATVITLTATVQAGASALTHGQVNFCDASAAVCTDIHLLGTA